MTDTCSAFMPGTDEATRKRIACTWPSESERPFWSVSITDAVAGLSSRTNRLGRSEEHTSELQSLMRISYAVFCLKKKKKYNRNKINMTKKEYSKKYSKHV